MAQKVWIETEPKGPNRDGKRSIFFSSAIFGVGQRFRSGFQIFGIGTWGNNVSSFWEIFCFIGRCCCDSELPTTSCWSWLLTTRWRRWRSTTTTKELFSFDSISLSDPVPLVRTRLLITPKFRSSTRWSCSRSGWTRLSWCPPSLHWSAKGRPVFSTNLRVLARACAPWKDDRKRN